MPALRVQVLTAGSQARPEPHLAAGGADAPAGYGGWRPRTVLGAAAPGGLVLPPAQPTAAWMYGPRGVWTDGRRVVAADTGNHRLLIWHSLPGTDGAPADVVLGQPDEHSEGPAASGRGPERGLHLPTGVLVHDGRLIVADAWHHRVLVWNGVPTGPDAAPDLVLGQPDACATEPNAGGEPSAGTLYWPFGLAVIDGRFYVTDTGNRRVLVWTDGVPDAPRPADVVLGQPDPSAREENRGGPATAASFRWPHAVAGTGRGGVLVADAGNHRVLRWDAHPDADLPADAVLGQPDFSGSGEFPYVSQAGRLRFPYGLSTTAAGMAVADTANNRVLIYPGTDPTGNALPGHVLGQPTHSANGENRWEQVAADTMCWPYGIHWHLAADPGDGPAMLLAVADSGNNRVVIWEHP